MSTQDTQEVDTREEFVRLFKEANRNANIMRASLRGLLSELGMPNAEVVHIFDAPVVRRDLLGNVDFSYKTYVKLVDVAVVRESIREMGVLLPIIVAASPSNNRLWVLDGGTRVESLELDSVVDWKVMGVDPEADQLHMAVALAIALNTLVGKNTRGVAEGVYAKFRGFFASLGITEEDVFGTSIGVAEEVRGAKSLKRVVDGMKQAKTVILAMGLPSEVEREALRLIDAALSVSVREVKRLKSQDVQTIGDAVLNAFRKSPSLDTVVALLSILYDLGVSPYDIDAVIKYVGGQDSDFNSFATAVRKRWTYKASRGSTSTDNIPDKPLEYTDALNTLSRLIGTGEATNFVSSIAGIVRNAQRIGEAVSGIGELRKVANYFMKASVDEVARELAKVFASIAGSLTCWGGVGVRKDLRDAVVELLKRAGVRVDFAVAKSACVEKVTALLTKAGVPEDTVRRVLEALDASRAWVGRDPTVVASAVVATFRTLGLINMTQSGIARTFGVTEPSLRLRKADVEEVLRKALGAPSTSG